MSYHPYYEPTDDGRRELEDELMAEAIESTWWDALGPHTADRIALDTEACVDTAGSILLLAAYGKRHPTDLAYIRDRLIDIMTPAIERQARWNVERSMARDTVSDIRRERANVE